MVNVAVGPSVLVPGATDGPEIVDPDSADVPSVGAFGWVCGLVVGTPETICRTNVVTVHVN